MSWDDEGSLFKVVVNHERQYSIWPQDRDSPLGWDEEGKEGTKAECLAYVEEVWTDMRPLSLQVSMQETDANPVG
jgi:MbtH protein